MVLLGPDPALRGVDLLGQVAPLLLQLVDLGTKLLHHVTARLQGVDHLLLLN